MLEVNGTIFSFVHQGAGYYSHLDGFFVVLTSYASFAVVSLVLFYFFFWAPALMRDAKERLRRLGQALQISLSLFVTWVFVLVLKVTISHPRPFVTLLDTKPLVDSAPFESFPSAHAAIMMALAISVLPYRKHLGHLLILFAFIVGLSRLYVGVHYPFDVIVGFIIGFLVPKLIYEVFRK